jgi:hypothetical protein
MHGWNASEKTSLSGELKIGRIERIIVEAKNRDGGGVPPPAGEGGYKGAFGGRGSGKSHSSQASSSRNV